MHTERGIYQQSGEFLLKNILHTVYLNILADNFFCIIDENFI